HRRPRGGRGGSVRRRRDRERPRAAAQPVLRDSRVRSPAERWMTKIRVLVADDSALMRQLLTTILSSDPEIEVVGAAADAIGAWEQIQRLRPDVLTLDVEMPRMDGLEFLERLMRAHPMPVVTCSSLTEPGGDTTLRALELGAVDFVNKPKIDVQRGVEMLGAELIAKVKARGALASEAAHDERLEESF